ncbi:MAG: PAS domain S-box protein [Bacteroidetes bacterium]|nr:MAG: PAS domain S-box protein [Bacteroidota bacterium]TAF92886.1 MAG: PAS domain S-box protein [Bacteroidota bacterium]
MTGIAKLIPTYLRNSSVYYALVTDLNGNYTYVNPLFQNRYSFVCDDFIGKPSFIAIYEGDQLECLKTVEACLRDIDSIQFVQLRKPNTSLEDFYWTDWEFSVLKDENNAPVGIFCLGKDATEFELAKKTAVKLTEKIELIIEEMTDGFYVLDPNWDIVRVNSVAALSLGFTRESMLYRNIWNLFPDSYVSNYQKYFYKAVNEKIVLSFEDYRPDLEKWFSVVCYPSDEGLSVFFKDITVTKNYLKKIIEQEQALDSIYQSTTDACTFVDKDFIIRYNNQVARDVTKLVFGREAQIGDSSVEFFLPEFKDEFIGYYHQVLQGERISVERFDGKRWWLFSLFPVYCKGQKVSGIANVVQDITPRKEIELKMLSQNNILREIAWQQSHELRSPVSNIMALLKLLKDDDTASELQKLEYVNHLSTSVMRLDDVIRAIVQRANDM